LLWHGDNPSMAVLQEGKRRGPNSEPLVRSFSNARTCAADAARPSCLGTTPPAAATSTKAGPDAASLRVVLLIGPLLTGC
jgi:hypothetical protein